MSKQKEVASVESQTQIAPLQWFHTKLTAYQAKVLPALLKKHNIEPEHFIQIVIDEVKKNGKLLDAARANPSSMFASIIAGAEIGLMPSELLGEFYLIPRNLKQPDGAYKPTVCPLIGYKGIVKLLYRSGDIIEIRTEVVYEGDTFEHSYGLNPNIEHKKNYDVPRTAGKLTFVYAIAKNKWGGSQFVVLSRQEIINIQKLSKYENELYFNDKLGVNRWMERKTAIIQLAKLLPKDYYSQKAIEMDGRLEGGAILTLGENNETKLIEGAAVAPKRFRDISGGLSRLADEAGKE